MLSAANNKIASQADLNLRSYAIGNNQSPDDGARNRLAERQERAIWGNCLIIRWPFQPIRQPEVGAFSGMFARG
jgi:hypothetical protein